MTKIVSIDGTSLNDSTYRSFFVMSYGTGGQKATYVGQSDGRPSLSALDIEPRYLPPLQIVIEGANAATARRALHRLFFQKDKKTKTLVVTDDDGGNSRSWSVIVEAFDQTPGTGGLAFVATMRAVDDNALRGTTPDTASTTVTTSPTNLPISNSGDLDSYPVISLAPNTAKTGTWQYRRFIRLRWQSSEGASRYPVDVLDTFDTTALVSGGKMQADGRDLRVMVNGVMLEPYITGPNTVSTKAWVALDFAPYDDLTLLTAIGASGAVTAIDVNEDVSSYPSQGLLVIGNEIFSYSGRNTILKQFTGVTRAERGSSMAAHSAGTTVWFCQNDVWVLYGHNGSLPALAPNDLYRPAFDLAASTNAIWEYNADDLGDNVGYRPAAWRFIRRSGPTGATYPFTEPTGADIDPWDVIGIGGAYNGAAEWLLSVPTGVSALTMSGQKWWYEGTLYWRAAVVMRHRTKGFSGGSNSNITEPTATGTWQTWTRAGTVPTVPKTEVGYRLDIVNQTSLGSDWNMLYADQATVTIWYPVLHAMLPEQQVYSLDVKLTNTATGHIVALRYDMGQGDTMVIDTDARKVYLASSGKSAFAGLTMRGEKRAEWLPLAPGANTLKFEESGVSSLDFDVESVPRFIF